MDRTLQVIKRAGPKYEVGDVLAVFDTAKIADWVGGEYRMRDAVGSPHTVFVHVTQIPDRHDVIRLRHCEWNPPKNDMDPHSGGRKYMRKWQVQLGNIGKYQELMERKEITLTWKALKRILRNKADARMCRDEDLA